MKHNRFRHLLLAAMALTATTAAAQTVEQADTMALPTDTYWLRHNYVSVTPLHVDQTDFESLQLVDDLLKGM